MQNIKKHEIFNPDAPIVEARITKVGGVFGRVIYGFHFSGAGDIRRWTYRELQAEYRRLPFLKRLRLSVAYYFGLRPNAGQNRA